MVDYDDYSSIYKVVNQILDNAHLADDSKTVLTNRLIDDYNHNANKELFGQDISKIIALIPFLHDLQRGTNLNLLCRFTVYTLAYNIGKNKITDSKTYNYDNISVLNSAFSSNKDASLNGNALFDFIDNFRTTGLDYRKSCFKFINKLTNKSGMSTIISNFKSKCPFILGTKTTAMIGYIKHHYVYSKHAKDNNDRLTIWSLKCINHIFNQFLLKLDIIRRIPYDNHYTLTKIGQGLLKHLKNKKVQQKLNRLSYQPLNGWYTPLRKSISLLYWVKKYQKKQKYEDKGYDLFYGMIFADGLCNLKNYKRTITCKMNGKQVMLDFKPTVYLCIMLTLISSIVNNKKISGKARVKNIISTIKNLQWASFKIKKFYE